jgi:hypothetical protein
MLVKIFTGNSVDEPTTEATAAITDTLNGC